MSDMILYVMVTLTHVKVFLSMHDARPYRTLVHAGWIAFRLAVLP